MQSTFTHKVVWRLTRALVPVLMGSALASAMAQSVDLADRPLFSQTGVPGNLMLALSVEWPTASTPAYLSTTPYAATNTYLGYFVPTKCYRYNVGTPVETSYFSTTGLASGGTCTSSTSSHQWSGNYLNWAAMQSLDIFRSTLTGGHRAVDNSQTILEKTRHSGQGGAGIYPNKTLAAGVSGATPFTSASLESRVYGMGTFVQFSPMPMPTQVNCTFSVNNNRRVSVSCTGSNNVSYNTNNNQPTAGSSHSRGLNFSDGRVFTCVTTRSSSGGGNSYDFSCVGSDSGVAAAAQTCTASATFAGNSAAAACSTASVAEVDYTGSGTLLRGQRYRAQIRVKACDAVGGVETNCKAYSGNYKPEGLMQEYAMQLRYGVFGYLNDDNLVRDGGVLRAQVRSIGPQAPVPGSAPVSNAYAEWNATTGIFVDNPDVAAATLTTSDATAAGYTVTVNNSGAINYLNQFGKLVPGDYKGYDPVSEMYYAATRYFRNQGNVPAYTSLAGAGSQVTLAKWIDGFPVIRNWNDPIQYSCQKNFILGIGDVYTWADKNLPGAASSFRTTRAGWASSVDSEPSMPTEVSGDSAVNVTTATNMVGQLEGITNLATQFGRDGNGSNRANSNFLAGLAYDAHTKDIRPEASLPGKQTISTYWLDVRENQTYESRNQYWLAAKYGGFDVSDTFDPYAASNSTSTIGNALWSTDGQTVGADRRPNNYFVASDPLALSNGLRNAFARIASENAKSTSTSFSTSTAKVQTTATASYSASYDPKNWAGELIGSELTFVNNVPGKTQRWNAATLLNARDPNTRKIVTCCGPGSAALPFRSSNLAAVTLSSRTNYASFGAVPGVDAGSQSQADFVAYLRGDRTQPKYRARSSVLGDIVNSRPTAVGRPEFPYADQYNPGYGAFKSAYRQRKTVVYVGANDGMLHAFDGAIVASAASPTPGEELFAFIPSFAYNGVDTASTTGLAALGNANYQHRYYVDSTAQNFDVDFNRTAGISTTPDWRTLLIGGLGKGGRGYYALDITDPASWTSEPAVASKVLWEFPRSTDSVTLARMGYSFNEPMVVRTAKYGWTVIFTSGYNNSDGMGYLFLVNPRNGDLLETIATPEGSVGNPLHMTQANAYVPLVDNFVANAAYVGDMLGNVWRFDLTPATGTLPAPTKIAQLADADGNAQPITVPPVVDVEPISGKRYVVVGTGRLLADSDIARTQRQTLYAIADGTRDDFYRTLPTGVSWPITRSALNVNLNPVNGIGSAPAKQMGWYMDFAEPTAGSAERVNIPLAADRGQVAVAANTPTAHPCDDTDQSNGTGRLFTLNLADGTSALERADPAAPGGSVRLGSSPVIQALIDTVAFVSVSGKRTVLFGTGKAQPTGGAASNDPCKVGADGIGACGPSEASASLKRLNWREVQTAN
jgi:type IV pilus assembly protein PilY1